MYFEKIRRSSVAVIYIHAKYTRASVVIDYLWNESGLTDDHFV